MRKNAWIVLDISIPLPRDREPINSSKAFNGKRRTMNMKPKNAAVTPANANPGNVSEHDLWIGGRDVLTIAFNKQCKMFPPVVEHCDQLNEMIQGLARAAKAVIFHAENDPTVDTSFAMQPIESITDAIILLSQLSGAVRSEIFS